ncbi:hypothetical protein KIPB_014835, partial [Kipferlia bialata]|eukprot:g14835.t1
MVNPLEILRDSRVRSEAVLDGSCAVIGGTRFIADSDSGLSAAGKALPVAHVLLLAQTAGDNLKKYKDACQGPGYPVLSFLHRRAVLAYLSGK